MRMPIIIVSVLTLFVTAAAVGQEKPADPVKEKIDTLLAEHENSELGYAAAYRAFLPRFEEFARAHHGTEPEVRATLWLIQQTWWLRSDGNMEKTSMPLARDLLKRHPESPQLGLLVEYKYVFNKKQRLSLFERLAKSSPHDEVKAAAHFGLAQLNPARTADGAPNPHFKILIDEYAEVPWRETTFGQIADAYLNPLNATDLAIGKQAPEIEGIDENGKPMKLSDYRGRVVLLDFWGDW